MNRVLITGASGFIGSHLVDEALKRGFEVHAAVRPSSNRDFLKQKDLQFFNIDFNDTVKLAEELSAHHSFDYIIHTAGLTKAARTEDYYNVNFGATRNIVEALMMSGATPAKFIYISSQAAQGPSDDGVNGPVSDYGLSKLKAESMLKVLNEFPWLIVRPAAVFGPHDKEFLKLFRVLRMGIAPHIGLHNQSLNLIYVKDLARGVMELMLKGRLQSEYFVSDGAIYQSSDFNNAALKVMNKKGVGVHIPLVLMKGIAYMNEMISGVTGRTTMLNRQRLKEFAAESWISDASHFLNEMNFSPRYNLDTAMQETIEWYQKAGWLKR